MKYSIDTSAILDGWIRYYPPRVFPSIWTNIERLITSGAVRATEEVLYELEKKDDDAYEWAKRQSGLFVPIDEATQSIVTHILAQHERLVDTRKNRSGADPFVIALAEAHNAVVVTGEPATNNLEKPNIPDVCSALDIKCTNLLGLFQLESWTV